MPDQFLAIARNTFFESIRQPIMLVMVLVGAILIVCSNMLSGFTMEDDQKMYIDIGLATVFLFGTLLSAMVATSVLTREIENKTALTVVAKPVPRATYVLGKYVGVVGAMLVAIGFLSFVFMLVERHQVLQTVRDPLHWPVIMFGIGSFLIAGAVGVWSNYFYNKAFPSTFLCVGTFCIALAYGLSLMLDDRFGWQDPTEAFRPQLWYAIIVLLVAVMVITAVAIAASTRFGQVMTLVITIGMFVLGLLSDAMFGRTMASLETRWSQRVETLPETAAGGPSLERLRPRLDVDRVRVWNREVLTAEAASDRRVAELEVEQQIINERRSRALRDPERGDSQPEAAFDERMDGMRQREMERIAADYAEAIQRIEDQVDQIDIPLTTSDLTNRVRTPQIFELVSGDTTIETDAKAELVAFPAAVSFVASTNEQALHTLCTVGYALVPNFQTMLLTDAVTQGHVIPGSYVITTMAYGGVQIVLFLALGVMLFQGREVG